MTGERFADEELSELIGLIGGADSVELKLTVPDSRASHTAEALGMDPPESVLRQVYFLDTPKLELEAARVIVRARRTQGKPDDTVVKLRPVVPNELPGEFRAAKTFSVEVDAMPGGFVCSASFKGEVKAGRVREAMAGERAISKLFSKEQRAFYAEHAPDGIGIDDLAILGPVHCLKLKQVLDAYGRRLVAELWFYPDGSRILELSTKLSGEQQTKTRTALEFFASEIGGIR